VHQILSARKIWDGPLHKFSRLSLVNRAKSKREGEKHMLNKQLISVAIVSVLCCAAVQVDAAKQAKGGGGNHMQRGIQLAQQKQFDAAAEEFGKAIKDNPKDPRGYANRGTAYRQGARTAVAAGDSEGASTRYQAALADFAKYIELAPKDASAYTEHGQTLSELKQYDAALADFNKALELRPDDLNTIKFRGFAELGVNQWDKAVADFSTVIQKKPDDLQSYDRRALAYRNMKPANYDAAIADYTFLITKNPNDMEATTKRGYTYSLAQQYEKAIADYQVVMKANPQDNETFQRLQYAQSMLAAKNASPSPTPPIPSPTPEEKKGLMDKISPLSIGIGVIALIIIAVIVRLITRGKVEETSHRIR
jgi:tetratricopeptide (TPR) repeat protein